jgi:glutathione S-transferase
MILQISAEGQSDRSYPQRPFATLKTVHHPTNLYIANKLYSSWSLRPWVLMSEKSIPFTEQIVPLAEGSSWEKYRTFAPNGRVPCLHDNQIVVWDSLAIVEYLAERHP